eukprot:7250404-Pyramimonas_sp.AAC.1
MGASTNAIPLRPYVEQLSPVQAQQSCTTARVDGVPRTGSERTKTEEPQTWVPTTAPENAAIRLH